MDRHNWYYRFLADVAWLENHVGDIERNERALVTGFTETQGVTSGFDVTENGGGQDFSVDVSSGAGYDRAGRRIFAASLQNLPFVDDENGDPIEVVGGGNARVVAIYARYALVNKPGSEVIDGFGDQVFTITEELVSLHLYQGAEAPIGTELPPADPGLDQVLLAYVQIRNGDLTIANADIDNDVKLRLTFAATSISKYVHTESPAAAVWNIAHNFNSINHFIQVMDENDKVITAGLDIQLGANTDTITFLDPQEGSAVLF